MITLQNITRDNFHDVLRLSVLDEQKDFVASNMYSLAQAKAQPECVPLAIYCNLDLVGFMMYCMDVEDQEYWIYRLMIDKQYQQQGYGSAAMNRILEILRQDTEHNKVYISVEPENGAAIKLYEKKGFVADGRVLDGEVVYCLQY